MWTWLLVPAHTETQVPWTIMYVQQIDILYLGKGLYRLCLIPKATELSIDLR